MTTTGYLATSMLNWHDSLPGGIGAWVMTCGLRIALWLIGSVLVARFIKWAAQKVTQQLDEGFEESDALVRPEAVKHRQAVASVISWVAIAVLYVVVAVEVTQILGVPVGSLVAPAAVLGAALGFGAQRIVQDLLSGFFILAEKQYGFGDLVRLTVTGAAKDAAGTVEDVTLRITKLRDSEGEVFTIPNGQIVKAVNLSKDWARAVVDIPVPVTADLNQVNDVLRQVCTDAMQDDSLRDLLLDEPSLMGVESIEKDTVNMRMVARTLPGKQFDVGRRLRLKVVAALSRAGIATPGAHPPTVGAMVHPATEGGAEEETQGAPQRR
ncbi:MAG: MscS Mechanosensitive ion channel [Mycobacterium sp.]|jgi:small-conductance mechanosensitive channel|nr:MscS Mechanosensitive ion channel [Mycobacterium sp.]